MSSIARSRYLEAKLGVALRLERDGAELEDPRVFDSVARELKQMASKGLVRILREDRTNDGLITALDFERLR